MENGQNSRELTEGAIFFILELKVFSFLKIILPKIISLFWRIHKSNFGTERFDEKGIKKNFELYNFEFIENETEPRS